MSEHKSVPEWAIERARRIWGDGSDMGWTPTETLARYIAEHEEAPVDPLLIEARRLAGVVCIEQFGGNDEAAAYERGEFDDDIEVQEILEALRKAGEQK